MKTDREIALGDALVNLIGAVEDGTIDEHMRLVPNDFEKLHIALNQAKATVRTVWEGAYSVPEESAPKEQTPCIGCVGVGALEVNDAGIDECLACGRKLPGLNSY